MVEGFWVGVMCVCAFLLGYWRGYEAAYKAMGFDRRGVGRSKIAKK